MSRRAALIVGVLLAALLPTLAGAASPDRRASLSYSLNSTQTVVLGAAEDRVTAVADDAVSAVSAVTLTGTTPAGVLRTASGCNRASLAMPPRSTVRIEVRSGSCGAGQVALATYGTLALSFHHMPRAPVRRVASAANRWALLVGIRDYAGRTESTVGGEVDVAAIRSALLRSGWRSDHIRVVTEKSATAQGIRDGMAWLVARSTADTFTLMHYSGHICIASRGPCARGHTYLWSQDNRFIPETEVASTLSRLRGYSWLDVAGCEAGAFDNGFHSSRRLFSASSRADETSYEDPGEKQSVWVSFTWSQGYNRGQADVDRRAYHATMRQMVAYGAARAPTFTSTGEAGAQHPVWAGGDSWWSLAAPPGR